MALWDRVLARVRWFMGESLAAVAFARSVAIRAQSIARQNFAIALAYNLLAVPIAMAGLATPLIAAIAMSSSSLIVIANALRMALMARSAGHAGFWGKEP